MNRKHVSGRARWTAGGVLAVSLAVSTVSAQNSLTMEVTLSASGTGGPPVAGAVMTGEGFTFSFDIDGGPSGTVTEVGSTNHRFFYEWEPIAGDLASATMTHTYYDSAWGMAPHILVTRTEGIETGGSLENESSTIVDSGTASANWFAKGSPAIPGGTTVSLPVAESNPPHEATADEIPQYHFGLPFTIDAQDAFADLWQDFVSNATATITAESFNIDGAGDWAHEVTIEVTWDDGSSGTSGPIFDGLTAVEVVYEDLTLVSDQIWHTTNPGQVKVAILKPETAIPIVGGDFYIGYDTTYLEFVSANPGDSPYVSEIFEVHDPGNPGSLFYAVGVDPLAGDPATDEARIMAVLTFHAVGEVCDVDELVWFDGHQLSDDQAGGAVIHFEEDLNAISIDDTPPTLVNVPADITVDPTIGTCQALVSMTPPTATDTCDPDPVVTYERSDGLALSDPFPAGPNFFEPSATTTITWTAEDAAGNIATATTVVTNTGTNPVTVDIFYPGVASAGRCINIEIPLLGADQPISITFDLDGEGQYVDAWPCHGGALDAECVLLRDELHSLRSLTPISVIGNEYVGSTTLLGGDLNDDGVVDILDFGIFVFQFGQALGVDTPCGTPGPHADISGNGVVGTADFLFIQMNYLLVDELCPGSPLMAGRLPQPRERISVRELHRLGLGHLEVADLTGDGWVGPRDIAAFAAGARPEK